jgi:hypothetical protein
MFLSMLVVLLHLHCTSMCLQYKVVHVSWRLKSRFWISSFDLTSCHNFLSTHIVLYVQCFLYIYWKFLLGHCQWVPRSTSRRLASASHCWRWTRVPASSTTWRDAAKAKRGLCSQHWLFPRHRPTPQSICTLNKWRWTPVWLFLERRSSVSCPLNR